MKGRWPIQVVAAVVEREGLYLITQRTAKAVFALYWEFPGGKVEPGETDAQALVREIREELDVEIAVGELLAAKVHEYPEFAVDFRVYHCSILSGDIKSIGVADFRWVTVEEMKEYPFPPADVDAIERLAVEYADR